MNFNKKSFSEKSSCGQSAHSGCGCSSSKNKPEVEEDIDVEINE